MYVNIYDQYFWRKSFWRKDKKFAQVYFKMQKERWKKKTFEEKVSAKPFLKFHVRFSTSFYLWPINGTTNIPYI